MIKKALILAALAPVLLGLFACASREELQAERVAKQAASEAEDDAKCRAASNPGTPEYDNCRQDRAAERARQADIDYQKARDFDRTLGGLDDL